VLDFHVNISHELIVDFYLKLPKIFFGLLEILLNIRLYLTKPLEYIILKSYGLILLLL